MPFRIIPILLLADGELVKTNKFKKPTYIGDPLNVIKIFNDKQIDELILLDIKASKRSAAPNFKLIEEIASECFFPLTYGGGLKRLSEVDMLIGAGVEKVSIQTSIFDRPDFVSDVVKKYGSQSVVASIDIKKNFWGKKGVYSHAKNRFLKRPINQIIDDLEEIGIGELLFNNVDRDGTLAGVDFDIVQQCLSISNVPVIIAGGLSTIDELRQLSALGVAAAAGGAYFVFKGAKRGVLITYPGEETLTNIIGDRFE